MHQVHMHDSDSTSGQCCSYAWIALVASAVAMHGLENFGHSMTPVFVFFSFESNFPLCLPKFCEQRNTHYN